MKTIKDMLVNFFFGVSGVAFLAWVWITFLTATEKESGRDVAMLFYFSFLGVFFAFLPFFTKLINKVGDSEIGRFFRPPRSESELHLQDMISFVGELGILTYIYTLLQSFFKTDFSVEFLYISGVLATVGTVLILTLACYSFAKLMEQTKKAKNIVAQLVVFSIGAATLWFHFQILVNSTTC